MMSLLTFGLNSTCLQYGEVPNRSYLTSVSVQIPGCCLSGSVNKVMPTFSELKSHRIPSWFVYKHNLAGELQFCGGIVVQQNSEAVGATSSLGRLSLLIRDSVIDNRLTYIFFFCNKNIITVWVSFYL